MTYVMKYVTGFPPFLMDTNATLLTRKRVDFAVIIVLKHLGRFAIEVSKARTKFVTHANHPITIDAEKNTIHHSEHEENECSQHQALENACKQLRHCWVDFLLAGKVLRA